MSGFTDCSEDFTILSGNLRSTLEVFEEYQDAEVVSYMPRCLVLPMMMIITIYISMKHFVASISSHLVHTPTETSDMFDANVFRDLDSSVSEGGDNFSTGSVIY